MLILHQKRFIARVPESHCFPLLLFPHWTFCLFKCGRDELCGCVGSAFVTCSLPLASLGYTGAPTSTSTHLPSLSVAYNLSLFYTHSLSLFYTNPSLYYTSTLSLSCTHTISHTHNLSNLDIHSLCLTHTPLTLTHLINLSPSHSNTYPASLLYT